MGGVLLSIYGEPRSTKDLDVILNLRVDETEKIRALIEVLEENNLHLPGGFDYVKGALKDKTYFSAFNSSYVYWMDLQGIYSFWDEIVFKTRRKITILGLETWIESMEALIVAKLSIYYSETGLKDAESIVRLNRDKLNIELLLNLQIKWGLDPA